MTSKAYVAWLREQDEKDKLDHQAGLSPLPRSKDERQAIFYALSVRKRRRLRGMRNLSSWKIEKERTPLGPTANNSDCVNLDTQTGCHDQ